MIGAPNTQGQKYWVGIVQWAPETSVSEEIADIFRNYDIDILMRSIPCRLFPGHFIKLDCEKLNNICKRMYFKPIVRLSYHQIIYWIVCNQGCLICGRIQELYMADLEWLHSCWWIPIHENTINWILDMPLIIVTSHERHGALLQALYNFNPSIDN